MKNGGINFGNPTFFDYICKNGMKKKKHKKSLSELIENQITPKEQLELYLSDIKQYFNENKKYMSDLDTNEYEREISFVELEIKNKYDK